MVIKKLPDQDHPYVINLGFKTVDIVMKVLDTDDLFGCWDPAANLITIDPRQTLESYKWCLLHEICHVGFDLFGLGDDDEIPVIKNEFLVTVTSNMMKLLWSLNPELFEYIFNDAGYKEKL